jgi:hypothetical protein
MDLYIHFVICLHGEVLSTGTSSAFFIYILPYFPGVSRVFIYPNLIVICVSSLAEIAHFNGIFSIITSTLLGGTYPLVG